MTDAEYSVVSPMSALYVPIRIMCSTVYCGARRVRQPGSGRGARRARCQAGRLKARPPTDLCSS